MKCSNKFLEVLEGLVMKRGTVDGGGGTHKHNPTVNSSTGSKGKSFPWAGKQSETYIPLN